MADDQNPSVRQTAPPASPSGGDSGSVLPRAALERVLARATELQTSGAETPETISEARLLEIGREVGIDPNHLRMAIAEERGRSPMLPDTPGRIEQALGDAHTGTQRAVPGTPDTVLASLDRWLQREEHLVVKRRFGQRMSWERARNPFASISRSLSGKPADLQKVDEVSAVVTPVDGTRSLVRLDADLRLHRKSLKDGTMVLAVVNGVLAAGWIVPVAVLSAVSPTTPDVTPLAVLAVTMGSLQAGVSTLIWRGIKKSFREAMVRTQLRLEQLLDALEHGDAGSPPSLLEQLKQSLSSTRL
jgi:hypothetical protein